MNGTVSAMRKYAKSGNRVVPVPGTDKNRNGLAMSGDATEGAFSCQLTHGLA